MKKLPIDVSLVADMMCSNRYEIESYLDKETGEVIYFTEEMVPWEYREVEREELDELLADENESTRNLVMQVYEVYNDESDRYEEIPEIHFKPSYEDMREFVESIQDSKLRDKVLNQIQGTGAFRRFRTFLDYHAEYRKAWISLLSNLKRQEALNWLESIDIEAIDTISEFW